MKFLLDTSAIVHYLKFGNVHDKIKSDLPLFDGSNTSYISVVTLGELKSLVLRNEWSETKTLQLNSMLDQCRVVPISSEIVDIYADIDSFSQGQSTKFDFSEEPIKMGKNDLWIAATASYLSAKLVTVDKDFSHLSNVFVDVILLSVRGRFLDTENHNNPIP